MYEWLMKYKSEVLHLADAAPFDPVHIANNLDNSAKVEQRHGKPRVRVHGVAGELEIGRGVAHHSIHKVLHHRKVSAWWVTKTTHSRSERTS